MVLESLIGEKNIRRHPVFLFFLTLLICFGSIIIADYMFPAHSSILSIAFITIGLVPLIFNVLSDEEKEEVCSRKHFTTFFARHFNLIMMYIWIFVGVIVAFSIYYAVVPAESRTVLFEEQIKSFCMISGSDSCIGGKPLSISGLLSNNGVSACLSNEKNVASCSLFLLWNNGGVLALTIILSLLYGVGAIFTIVWNASILGIFFSETFLVGAAGKGSGMALNMLFGHGPPELLSYVFGALAGAILSAMAARGELFKHGCEVIYADVLFLVVLAFFSVAYGAVAEAIGLLGMGELYFVLGILYLFVIIVAVMIYGRKRSSPRFEF